MAWKWPVITPGHDYKTQGVQYMSVFKPHHLRICILSSHASPFCSRPTTSGLCVCSASLPRWGHALIREKHFERKEGFAVGYSPPGLRKAYSEILSPTHRFSWRLCTRLIRQGTGKTLWKPWRMGSCTSDRAGAELQGQTCVSHGSHPAPADHHHDASTINSCSTHTEETGGLTTGVAADPLLPAAGRRKAPSLFPHPLRLAALFPHSVLTLHWLSLPSHHPAPLQGSGLSKQQRKYWAVFFSWIAFPHISHCKAAGRGHEEHQPKGSSRTRPLGAGRRKMETPHQWQAVKLFNTCFWAISGASGKIWQQLESFSLKTIPKQTKHPTQHPQNKTPRKQSHQQGESWAVHCSSQMPHKPLNLTAFCSSRGVRPRIIHQWHFLMLCHFTE